MIQFHFEITVEDNRQLAEILKIDPEIMCGSQSRSGSCDARHGT